MNPASCRSIRNPDATRLFTTSTPTTWYPTRGAAAATTLPSHGPILCTPRNSVTDTIRENRVNLGIADRHLQATRMNVTEGILCTTPTPSMAINIISTPAPSIPPRIRSVTTITPIIIGTLTPENRGNRNTAITTTTTFHIITTAVVATTWFWTVIDVTWRITTLKTDVAGKVMTLKSALVCRRCRTGMKL